MTLSFSDGQSHADVIVAKGAYQVDLPAGTWSVSGTGGICATGIRVAAGAWQSDDLVYPVSGCQHMAGS